MNPKYRKVTLELMEEMRIANESLTGTLFARVTKLMKQFGVSRAGAQKAIVDLVPAKRRSDPYGPNEKDEIRRDYENSTAENKSQKIQELAEKYNRSPDSIRRVISTSVQKVDGEKMFDYRQPFI